jgi:phage terminase Nu1 subunit (DNA packaging protein)
MAEKIFHRISDAVLTLAEAAEATGKPVQTVHEWTKNGLVSRKDGRHRLISIGDLVRFLAAREYQPGSQRERLAKEQADKVALDNAAKRGELLHADHVAEVLTSLAANLGAQLDALPGRCASELAGLNEPGVIRARLLDETRGIRAAIADATARMAEPRADAADDGGDSEAAEETDGGGVGEPKPRATGRKRRAGTVAE